MIHYGRQSIEAADIEAVVNALRGDFLTTGPEVERFESALADHTGGHHVLAVSSGTAALHVAYAAAGIGSGDEVITPPLTFVATQAAAMHLGATPVFVDVQADTGNLDPNLVEAAITPRTRAITAVDFAGHPADMDELRVIADRHGLLLVEDAAHSLGSQYRGRPVGSLADLTTLSFYPTKNITTGEGGAVVSLDVDLDRRARRFARQGLVRDPDDFQLENDGPWHQEVHEIGLNYRLPDFCAALGTSQLARLAQFKTRRSQIKLLYDLAFEGADGVTVPAQRPFVDPMWHLYPLRVEANRRRAIFEHLRAVGIGVQVNYIPASRHPALRDLAKRSQRCPIAEQIYAEEISLPMHVGLTDAEVDWVATQVLEAIATAG